MHPTSYGRGIRERDQKECKWKQVVKEAMEEGGSSDSNIEEFVAKLLES